MEKKVLVLRNIVKIDEQKCNGCGVCIPACAEGALKIIDGQAKLVKDIYCDGLGACLGKCPQDAITIVQREAAEFDEEAAEEHMKAAQPTPKLCPSVKVMQFDDKQKEAPVARNVSRVANFPYQLKLIPPNAPFLKGSDLLIAADCVPFAYANFHEDMLKGKMLAIGCPKLDDASLYRNKLAEIFRYSNIQSITVVNMEVPCCFGLTRLVQEALELSGKTIPLNEQTVSIKGDLLPQSGR
jgi:Pyruvate/2-oxoacid:ferredoxin oxidoreductase delta subunit